MLMNTGCYLDHNATTPLKPQAMAAMCEALAIAGNPSSTHRVGRLARRMVEDARESVAALVGAAPADVVFTSGATEANALALAGWGGRRLLVSAIEHSSVLAWRSGGEPIPVDDQGVVRVEVLEDMLAASKKPAMVAVMLANNETGVVQPVARVAEVARRHGALVHCDGAQAAGKIAVDIKALGVHSLALSAHKLGGPAGVGALVLTGEREVTPLWRGGGQERGRRAGTENVAGIAGFGAAASTSLDAMVALAVWRDQVERSLREVAPALQVFGMTAERLPNTTCLTMPGVSSEIQVMAFDLAGISVSAGAACSSGKVASSHVLRAMGVDDADAECAIRISLGWNSRKDDIDRLVEAWSALYARLGRRAPASATAA